MTRSSGLTNIFIFKLKKIKKTTLGHSPLKYAVATSGKALQKRDEYLKQGKPPQTVYTRPLVKYLPGIRQDPRGAERIKP